jgi:hypothetical protein
MLNEALWIKSRWSVLVNHKTFCGDKLENFAFVQKVVN